MERALKHDLDESYLKMARKALQTGVRFEDELRAARAISRAKGKEEGKEEKKHEIALELLALGISHKDISQSTKLSLDEIKSLT